MAGSPVSWRVDRSSVSAVEFHAEQMWEATVALMAKARADGVDSVPVLPPWSQLTEKQRTDWLMHPVFEQIVPALSNVAAHIYADH